MSDFETEEINPIEVDREFSDLNQQLDDTNTQVDEICAVGSTIAKQGMVSKATAVTLESMDETILGDDTPINSFTVAPSKTNYHPTMEGIGERIAEMVKKVWDFLVELVRKAINFMTGKSKQSEKKRKKTEKKYEKASKREEEAKEDLEEKTEESQMDYDEAIKLALEKIEVYVKEHKASAVNMLQYRLFEDNDIDAQVRDLFSGPLDEYLEVGLDVMEVVEKAYEKMPRRTDELDGEGGVLRREIMAMLDRAYDTFKQDVGRNPPIQDYHRYLMEETSKITKLKDAPVEAEVDYSLLSGWDDRYNEVSDKSPSPMDFKRHHDILEEFRKRQDAITDGMKKHPIKDPEIGRAFTRALQYPRASIELIHTAQTAVYAVDDALLDLRILIIDLRNKTAEVIEDFMPK